MVISSEDVALSLTPGAKGYRPGEAVHALLHIRGNELANGGARPSTRDRRPSPSIQLEDVEITFKGIERVDTSWISKDYRKTVQPLTSDPRRVQRPILEASLRASTASDFGEDGCRVYLIRFRLPGWVPPTFQGLVVRYGYHLDVRVKWCDFGGSSRECRVRDVVTVWPGDGVSTSSALDTGKGRGCVGSGVPGDGSVQIKCWEVGYGTTIDDAIENVELLRQDSSHSVPYSPAYLSNSLSRTTSLDPGTGVTGSCNARQGPSELLSRKLFQAAQDAMLEEQRRQGELSGDFLRIVTEESASVIQGGVLSTPRTPIAEGPVRERTRYWDGMAGSVSSFRLRFADLVFVTIHLHPASVDFDEEGVQKPALEPGSSVLGTLEFSNADRVQCVKYTVSLEMEETVADAWRYKGRAHVLNQRLDERTSLAPDTLASSVYFTLPSGATPTFESDVVSLAWGLRFHFFLLVRGEATSGREKLEQVEWKIPIRPSIGDEGTT